MKVAESQDKLASNVPGIKVEQTTSNERERTFIRPAEGAEFRVAVLHVATA